MLNILRNSHFHFVNSSNFTFCNIKYSEYIITWELLEVCRRDIEVSKEQ